MRPRDHKLRAVREIQKTSPGRVAVTLTAAAVARRMAGVPTDGSEDELMAGVVVPVDGGWSVGALPPLPTPSSDKHWQAAWGCALVGSIVVTCVVITELSVRWSDDHFSHIWIARWLVLAESVAAFGFHAGLLFGGQGCVVRRTDDTCFPLPPEVATRLRDGAPLRDLANVEEGGATFCVRCPVAARGRAGGRRRVHAVRRRR